MRDITAVIIIIGIAILAALILSLRVKLYIHLDDGFTVRIGVGPVKKTLFPKGKKKPKRPRLSSFTYGKHEKRLEKDRKRAEKTAKKRAKKDARRQKRSRLTEKASSAAGGKKPLSERIGSLVDFIELIFGEIPYFASHLHTEVRRADISIGTGDAAKTAELYGGVAAAVSLLIGLLSERTKLKKIRDGAISVRADFIGEKTTAEIFVVMKLSLMSGIKVGARFLWQMAKKKSKQALQKIKQ